MSRILWVVAIAATLCPDTASADTVRIRVSDIAFHPAEASARVGDTVEWINDDFVDHTATAPKEGWDVVLPAGATGTVVVRHPGSIDYFCRFHPQMKGQLRVQAQ